jgi:hypothetical protein
VLIETLYMTFINYDSKKLYGKAMEAILQHQKNTKELNGDKSNQYAYSLFLESKVRIQ